MDYTKLINRRIVVFILSIVVFLSVLGLLGVLIQGRSHPQLKEPLAPAPIPVEVVTLEAGPQPVQVTVHGTVKPEKRIILNAPYAGRVQATDSWTTGSRVPANTPLFLMETTRLDHAIAQLHIKIEALSTEEELAQKDRTRLQKQRKTVQGQLDTAQIQLEKATKQLDIQQNLYEKHERLLDQQAISQAELLRSESALLSAEEGFLQAKQAMDSLTEKQLNLEQQFAQAQHLLKVLNLRRKEYAIELEQHLSELKKAKISVAEPTSIETLHIKKEQEVSPGTPLASVYALETMEIIVNLPDNYFHWLYQGQLLSDASNRVVIRLVNRNYPKEFSGGVLKTIGNKLNEPSRSLPLVIQRKNPVGINGDLIADEELKTGMYCEVELTLCHVENSYLAPLSVLQREDRLYEVQEVDGEEQLHIITNAEILHETDEQILFRIPDREEASLKLVSHPIRYAEEEMRVQAGEGAGA